MSDWSSDVCSSDLPDSPSFDRVPARPQARTETRLVCCEGRLASRRIGDRRRRAAVCPRHDLVRPGEHLGAGLGADERRVGAESVRQCKYRWMPYHKKKTKTNNNIDNTEQNT